MATVGGVCEPSSILAIFKILVRMNSGGYFILIQQKLENSNDNFPKYSLIRSIFGSN